MNALFLSMIVFVISMMIFNMSKIINFYTYNILLFSVFFISAVMTILKT